MLGLAELPQQIEGLKQTTTAMEAPGGRWIQFPHMWDPIRSLFQEIVATLDSELESLLLPSTTPSDVAAFQSPNGNAEGSMVIRAGSHKDQLKFVLGSWLHCQFPSGAFDISTLLVMLGHETQVPHFLFEFIQSSSNTAILLLDLIPRKDIVQEPGYLKRFYEDSDLEKLRQQLDSSPNSQVYVSSSLFVRSLMSPTAMLYKLNIGSQDQLKDLVSPIAKQVFSIWLNAFHNREKLEDAEQQQRMAERDLQIKSKGLEVDLSANLPKLFSQEITDRVIATYRQHD